MSSRRPLAALLIVVVALLGCSPATDGAEGAGSSQEPGETQGGVTPPPPPPPEPAEEPEPEARSPLTGEAVDEAVLQRPALLAKIENSPQARPQSGLEQADVVYEELVEGGVTRFFAVFHSRLPEVVGPIRSARPVDVQLMGTYGRAGFAYSGARDEVRAMLADASAVTITEGGAGFYRGTERSAPHNLYLHGPETLRGVTEGGAEPLHDTGWAFETEVPDGAETCPPAAGGCADPGAAIEIPMSRSFHTGWQYDADAGVYRRLQDDEPFLVTGPGRIGAANVVVLGVRHYVGPTGYPETDVVAETGPALILRDGHRFTARWSKPGVDAPLALTTPEGEPFPLKPGSTWLHLPPSSVVEGLIG